MAMKDRVKELRRVPASELRANPKNWRRHPPSQEAALRGVLEDIGFADAVIARETDDGLELIDGHLRQEVMGDQVVPVLIVDVTAEEADKMLLTYDPLAMMAHADQDQLLHLLRDTQFESQAVNDMLEAVANGERLPMPDLTEPVEDPGPQIDRADELREKWQTERGQVWEIGRHRLMCGDGKMTKDINILLHGVEPAIVLTDPPYGIDLLRGKSGTVGGGTRDYPTKIFDPVVNDDQPFDPSHLLELAEGVIIFGGNYCSAILPQSRCWFVWNKNHPVDRTFAGCELAWTNLDRHSKVYSITWDGWTKQGETGSKEHPTQKPVKLFADILVDVSSEADVILDPFLGSGTTMVAAEQLGRICYGMEIEPKYVAVTLERMSGMGLEPKLAGG